MLNESASRTDGTQLRLRRLLGAHGRFGLAAGEHHLLGGALQRQRQLADLTTQLWIHERGEGTRGRG